MSTATESQLDLDLLLKEDVACSFAGRENEVAYHLGATPTRDPVDVVVGPCSGPATWARKAVCGQVRLYCDAHYTLDTKMLAQMPIHIHSISFGGCGSEHHDVDYTYWRI